MNPESLLAVQDKRCEEMERKRMFCKMTDRVGLMQFSLKFSVLGYFSVMAG